MNTNDTVKIEDANADSGEFSIAEYILSKQKEYESKREFINETIFTVNNAYGDFETLKVQTYTNGKAPFYHMEQRGPNMVGKASHDIQDISDYFARIYDNDAIRFNDNLANGHHDNHPRIKEIEWHYLGYIRTVLDKIREFAETGKVSEPIITLPELTI